MNTHETLVRDLFHDATDGLSAPVLPLTEAATTGGRRLRRRRRALVAVGTLVVLTTLGVPVAASLGGSSDRGHEVAGDPTAPLPDPPPVTGILHWWDRPAPAMLAGLRALTPALDYTDLVLTNEGENAPGEDVVTLRGFLQADVVVEGETAGGVNVMLMAPGLDTDGRWTCPGNLDAPDRCTEITEPGGLVGRVSVTKDGGVITREVVLRQADGGLVYVAASNSADDKWGEGSTIAAQHVPLTIAQLRTIATDPSWTAWPE